ncbi:TetR family transcriptional regulator C-terminal domain-containing protein [Methylomarinum sp. Ch1-1]|uniref:TetR family transcriptional regulator C-terminal domain-containing protein n=1 Tax=Methylomarinum roseum TaxID=3067653 RepID=A0AAU7NRC8_9GAMM
MARPITFDRNHVLQQAINVFWLQGYTATSIKNLVDATGLQPGSLYAAFGDKRGLFLAALDAYFDDMKKKLFDVLHSDKAPLERLRAFFTQLIEESTEDQDRKGCLLINTLSEIPVQHEDINSRLQQMFAEVEQELKQLLTEAQNADELSADQDPTVLTKFLVSGIFGLRLYNKTGADSASLQAIVDQLLSPFSSLATHGKADNHRKPGLAH